jgi:hypothetical protein
VSEKRTVVDLRFSFFMTVSVCIITIGPSLPKSTEEAGRQLNDISQVSFCEEFQRSLHRNEEGAV